jgi:hypothetical protein
LRCFFCEIRGGAKSVWISTKSIKNPLVHADCQHTLTLDLEPDIFDGFDEFAAGCFGGVEGYACGADRNGINQDSVGFGKGSGDRVTVGNELIFSKKAQGRFPGPGEIEEVLAGRIV